MKGYELATLMIALVIAGAAFSACERIVDRYVVSLASNGAPHWISVAIALSVFASVLTAWKRLCAT
jgi:hypothetical protein